MLFLRRTLVRQIATWHICKFHMRILLVIFPPAIANVPDDQKRSEGQVNNAHIERLGGPFA